MGTGERNRRFLRNLGKKREKAMGTLLLTERRPGGEPESLKIGRKGERGEGRESAGGSLGGGKR